MFLARLESLSCAFLPLQQPTEAVVGGSVGHALRTDTPVDDAHAYVSADARTLRRHVQQGCPSALSQITENRKVEARKSLIFQYPIFGFCLQKATLRHIWTRPRCQGGLEKKNTCRDRCRHISDLAVKIINLLRVFRRAVFVLLCSRGGLER
jgi:hypothetical protein